MLSEKLLVVIRILSIVLLGIFIYTAVQGAFLAKELRDTVHSRLENDQFPIPLGDSPFSQAESTLGSSSSDADVSRQLERMQDACAATTAECLKQIGLLCNVLGQKGEQGAATACLDLRTAVERQDKAALNAAVTKLQSLLA